MSFLQNVWRDLVDKRLWPVAVLLVAAAVAVPVLLGGGSSSDVAAAPAPAPAPAETPGTAQVTVAPEAAATPKDRAGRARDPFRPLVFAKAAKATAASPGTGAAAATAPSASPATGAGAASGAGASSGAGKATGAGSGSGASGPATPSPAATTPSPATPVVPKTTTRFYKWMLTLKLKRSGKTTFRHDLQAVSYVPSPSAPLLAFLGVKSDGRTATFLVGDRVDVTGEDAVCRPSTTNCRFVEVKKGGTILVAKLPASGAAVTHTRLTLQDVAFRPVSSLTKAAATRRLRAAGAGALPVLASDARVTGAGR